MSKDELLDKLYHLAYLSRSMYDGSVSVENFRKILEVFVNFYGGTPSLTTCVKWDILKGHVPRNSDNMFEKHC